MKPSAKLFSLAERGRVPLLCTFELTRRCNLRCRHCYLSPDTAPHAQTLTTAAIKEVLRDLAKAGTLQLVFTGGEIFLRDDLLELCRYARTLRFDLRLFTNGTLIDGTTAAALAALSLSGVELSLYGREPVHDAVTRVPGSFRKTVAAVRLLKRAGIAVTLKCPLMTLNFRDRHWLIAFARQLGCNCRFDPTIAPRDNGDTANLQLRLTQRQLRSLYSDPLFFKPQENAGSEPPMHVSDEISCSAGKSLIAIASDGTVYPCLQLLLPLGNLRHTPLAGIWEDTNPPLAQLRKLSRRDLSLCNTCASYLHCQRCPGLALLEDHDLRGPSTIACKIAAFHESPRRIS